MHYFLCGFMASGKSSELNKLREKESFFGYSFYDLDNEIFKIFAKPRHKNLTDLINDFGLEWFRDTEMKTLLDIWKEKDTWVAMGGGTLNSELIELIANRADIQGFWMDTPFKICLERIKEDGQRFYAGLEEEEILRLFESRLETYKKFEAYKSN